MASPVVRWGQGVVGRGRNAVHMMLRGAMIAAAALVFAGAAVNAQEANHPFGSHPVPYTTGSILPGHVSQAALDQAVRDFYDSWKAEYIEQRCGGGRYVVRAGVSSGNLTVSEAHGYGMIIAALMAGADPGARAIFDGMYAYFREHPTAAHSHLMSWNQNRSCSDVEGKDSATDGDLDVAYALLLADRQWGSCGAVDYAAEAAAVLADVLAGDVDKSGQYMLLGDWVLPSNSIYYPSTRSSDFIVDHFRTFAMVTGNSTWTAIADRAYQIVNAIQTSYSPGTGLLPGFVVDPLGTPAPAPSNFLEGPDDGAYDYNACRDPWRLATDFLVAGDTRARSAVQAINTWIRSATGGDPTRIRSGYRLDGTMSADADFLSMAFVAPLGVGAMVDAANQSWLNAIWDLVTATPISAEGYYENTLKLLSMIVMSGNWWAPQSVAGGCTSSGNALCVDGGYISKVRVAIGGLGKGPGKQGLQVQANLFFPQGIPVTELSGGAQLLLEDMGSAGAAVYDLSAATTPVPAAADGACDPARDGWKTTHSVTVYRNRSGALDPPACTPDSARGLRRLRYRPRSSSDLDFLAVARSATLPAVVGPVKVTVVLGRDGAAGSSGWCGVSAEVSCTARGTSVHCR